MSPDSPPPASPGPYRVLSLDGGGAKGFYTLGVLKEIEGMVGVPLCERFDLVFGTSTGAIIAALIALGYRVDAIHDLYKKHVPRIMEKKKTHTRSQALCVAATVVGRRNSTPRN
jgi:patatin-like phospholipase/acyl hydrolase